MEVRHEAPIPDTLFRVTAPLIVGFGDGTWLRVNQWNLRGLYDARLAECTLDEVMLSVPFQGVGIFFEVTLVPGEGTDEFLFRDLTGRQRETLALFYRNLLSGRMAVTDEIITSLDTPVDLVPMEETEIEKQLGKAARAPRPLRAAASILVYVLIFVLVFSYLGSLALDRLSTLHAPMAFVTGQPNNPQGQPVIRARLTPDHVTDVWVPSPGRAWDLAVRLVVQPRPARRILPPRASGPHARLASRRSGQPAGGRGGCTSR
jgi:hypothetical protein